MPLLQHVTDCTVHDGKGGRCGVTAQCTTVRTLDHTGRVLHEHSVCPRHRPAMGLPEHDVEITSEGEHRLL